MLVESIKVGDDNKDNSDSNDNHNNSMAVMVVNNNKDILLPDKTSIFSLLTNAINLFRPKYGQTVVATMKWQTNMFFVVAKNELTVDIIIELHD